MDGGLKFGAVSVSFLLLLLFGSEFEFSGDSPTTTLRSISARPGWSFRHEGHRQREKTRRPLILTLGCATGPPLRWLPFGNH